MSSGDGSGCAGTGTIFLVSDSGCAGSASTVGDLGSGSGSGGVRLCGRFAFGGGS
jgi:hypothetical protein